MKRLLMIAYHFPPLAGSSGIQRTLRFAQHLPALGWEPIVLTAHPRAYEQLSDELVAEVPAGMIVRRAFALDSARHFAFFGRYPELLARPDRWVSWCWGAVPAGLALVRRYRPTAIWSTYPIATAHVIGAALQRRTGLAWVADFRDPMAQDGYPPDPRTWSSFKSIEERALRSAVCSVFTTAGTARMYRENYRDVPASRIRVIENGYDEESFASIASRNTVPLVPGKLTLLHSGIIYPSERDPTQFLESLRQLCAQGRISSDTLVIRLRAPVHERLLRKLVRENHLEGLVELAPPIPYREALAEMVRADGLVILQAANCNDQIPAKIYEYLRARRPILGLTDPAGDTAGVLRQAGLDAIARLDSVSEIVATLPRFLSEIRAGSARLPSSNYIEGASRNSRSRELAALLDEVAAWRS